MTTDDDQHPPLEDLLAECDREPIHIPGAVQSYGRLLGVDASGAIVVASARCEHTELPDADRLLGRPLAEFVLRADEVLSSASGEAATTFRRLIRPVSVTLAESGAVCDGVHSHSGDLTLIELLPPEVRAPELHPPEYLERTQQLVRDCATAAGLVERCAAMCRHVRDLSGFDRVMAYRFHPDHYGEVIAEARRDDMQPFIGLHYPASDIPRQARELFLRNRLRLIANVNAAPSPLFSRAGYDAPVDLSDALLRAVSPVHIEYLQNMGVGASMSISIVCDDRLWGLIACHHDGPMKLPPKGLAALELMALTFESNLEQAQLADSERLRQAQSDRVNHVIESIGRDGSDLVSRVELHLEGFAGVLDACGAVLWYGGRTCTSGEVMPENALRGLHSLLRTIAGPVFAVDSLPEFLNTFERDEAADPQAHRALLDAADELPGLLAVSLSSIPSDWLVFFRPEFLRNVDWGGAPDKRVVRESDRVRLSPRKSFDKWSEEIRGRSREWSTPDQIAAERIRALLSTLILDRASEVESMNALLRQANEELDLFAAIVSHDLQEPVRGVLHHSELLSRAIAGVGGEAAESLDSITRLGTRMAAMTETLLRYARVGRSSDDVSTFDLHDVIEETLDILEPRRAAADAEIVVSGSHITLSGNYIQIREVFDNLLVNALKYTADTPPQITIELAEEASADDGPDWAVIRITDNGIGIDPAFHDEVFKMFYRLHGRDEYGGGSGAGLAIVKRIIEHHGGQISIESELGGGTTFAIRLTLAR